MFTVTFEKNGEVHQWLYEELHRARLSAKLLEDRFGEKVVVAHLVHRNKFKDKVGNPYYDYSPHEVESIRDDVSSLSWDRNNGVSLGKAYKRPSVLARRKKRKPKVVDYDKLAKRVSFELPVYEQQSSGEAS